MLFTPTAVVLSLASLGAARPTSPAFLGPPVKIGPVVELNYGTFFGKSSSAYNGVELNSFLGVPFAQPPVGDLRLRLAVIPPKPFEGLQNATNYGPSCYQQIQRPGLTTGPSAALMATVASGEPVPNTSEDVSHLNPHEFL